MILTKLFQSSKSRSLRRRSARRLPLRSTMLRCELLEQRTLLSAYYVGTGQTWTTIAQVNSFAASTGFQPGGFTQARGVGHFHGPAVERELHRNHIARRAGSRRHHGSLIPGQRID